MRRAILPADRAEGPDQLDQGGNSATHAAYAPCGRARDAAATPQYAGVATTAEPPDAPDMCLAIQVIPPSECTNGRSSLLPTLALDGAAGGSQARGYDLDLPHETGVYLLAIVREGQHCRYFHARHYLGWAVDIADRVAAHRRGKGASFTQALVSQGYSLWLVAWFPGDRTAERAIKLTHHVPRFCPLCRAGLCLIDQPPRQEPSQVSSSTQEVVQGVGQMLHVANHVPEHALVGQRFRQDKLLALTDHGARDPGNAEDADGTEALVGDTFVELLPPDAG